MPKVVISSDWHLDGRTAGYSRFDDVARSAKQVINAAIEMQADLFIFAGDLTDPGEPVSYRATSFALECARELDEASIDSRWMTGNHDVTEDGFCTSTLTPLRGAGFHLVDCPLSEDFYDVGIVYLPYTPGTHPYDPEEDVRKVVKRRKGLEKFLVVAHLNIEGITAGSETTDMPRGRDVYLPVETIRQCFPNVVIVNAHYHERQVFNGVHIPGSVERQTFGEVGNDPGYLVVNI